jgi:hypothetical protein
MSHANPANLKPFTKGDPRASEAGRRGAQAREAKRHAQRADNLAIAQRLRTLTAVHQRDDLGPQAAAVAADILGRISAGEIPCRHVGDAAELLRVLVDVARLEAGETTTNAAVVHVSARDVAEHVNDLQRRAREVLASSAVLAADDNELEHEGGGTPPSS